MTTMFRQKLNENGIRFLVIGGKAMRLLGGARETKDYDYLIEVSALNLDSAYAAIVDYLGYIPKFQKQELLGLKKQMKLPNDVDVLTSIEGLCFSELYSRSQVVDIDGEAVHYPCANDMLQLKIIASADKNRSVDHEDIKFLETLCA